MQNRTRLLLGLGVFLAALTLFGVSLCRHFFPVDSAGLLCSHLGLTAFAPLDSGLWGGCMRLVSSWPLTDLATRVNAFSAGLGAACAAVLFLLVAGLPHDRTHEERRSQLDPARAGALSGVVAAALFCLSPNVWLVSTRAFPDTLGLLLLLLWALCMRQTVLERRPGRLAVASCLLGVGSSEYAPFIWCAPIWAVVVAAYAWKGRFRFRWRRILAQVGLALLGYSLVLWDAWRMWQSPSAEWRGYDHVGEALWAVFRQQKVLFARMIPASGWLLLALTAAAPLIYILLPKHREAKAGGWPSTLMHAALTVLAGLVFFPTWMSPYAQFHFRPIVVAPYALTAVWAGYLAGYWWCRIHASSRLDSRLMAGVKRGMRLGWPALLAGVLVALGLVNQRLVSPSISAWTAEYADDMLAALRGGETLALDSDQQHVLLLRAHEKGLDLKLVSPALSGAQAYVGYLRDLFTEPRLRGLASVGVLPALCEWLRIQPEAPYRSDFHDGPIFAAGLEALPEAPFHRAVRAIEASHAETVTARLRAWAERPYMRALAEPEDARGALYPERRHLRLTAAKLANNAGALCERLGREDLAESHYRLARTWNPENLSALLNLTDLAARRGLPDRAALQAELEKQLRDLGGKLGVFALSQVHGLVARHEAYLQRGLAWAVTGKPQTAAAEVRRAIQASRQDDRFQLQLAVAQFDPREPGASEATLREILARDPKHVDALAQLARVQAVQGDLASARASIARAVELRPDASVLLLQQAGVELIGGNPPAALEALRQATSRDPGNIQAWALLAWVADQAGDAEEVRRAERHLRDRPDIPTSARLTLAQLLLQRSDLSGALRMLEEARRREPGNPAVLELMLRVLHRQRDRHHARDVVHALLRIDPSHAFGNLLLGSLQYADGDLDLAEASMRASLEASPTAEALNSLAYVMLERGRASDALPLVRRSLEIQPDDPSTQDTLAMALLALGRAAEALPVMRQAVEGAPGNAELQIHLARVLEETGDLAGARAIADELFATISQVPPRFQPDVTDLRARLAERMKASGTGGTASP